MTKFPVSILHQQLKMKQYGRGETVQKNHRLFVLKTSVGKVRMSTDTTLGIQQGDGVTQSGLCLPSPGQKAIPGTRGQEEPILQGWQV